MTLGALELVVSLCFCEPCKIYFRGRKCDKCEITLRSKRARERDLAVKLCGLLAEHVQVCKAWEGHYVAMADKSYKKGEEKENHTWLRENMTAPFLDELSRSSFTYAEIIDIIPPAFETTHKQRVATYKDLVNWSEEIYG